MNPAKNIELKARLHDLCAARTTARRLATEVLGVQEQTDTYFHCPSGRMKLREVFEFAPTIDLPISSVVGVPNAATSSGALRHFAQLIWYERADQTDSKESTYQLVEVTESRVKQLKSEMGIRGIVAKRREVYLYHNVRIHLDSVESLGTFLEFEAVLCEGVNAAAGRLQLAALQKEFHIAAEDLLPNSYADMLLKDGP
jgi:adenylate cyclase class IV